MPPFAIGEAELQSLARWVHSLNASAYDVQPAGDAAAGERFFYGSGQCGACHMVAGRLKSNGPDLSDVERQLTLQELEQAVDDPNARSGNHNAASCPEWAWCPEN